MNDIVKTTIDGYLQVFNSYNIVDDELISIVNDFKNRLISFGDKYDDPMKFSMDFMSSEFQSEYADLITRVASHPSETPKETNQKEEIKKIPEVEEYLEQYRTSYEEVKKAGYRQRAEKEYENLFDVSKRTNDMLEAQIILEEERLLWKIVSEDMIDIYETIYNAMDPLSKNILKPIEGQLKIWQKADSDEEVTYAIDIFDKEKNIFIEKENFKIFIVAALSELLIGYNTAKMEFRTWGKDGKAARDGLIKMIAIRENIIKAYDLMKSKFGYDFDTINNDEWMRLWMLIPSNIDELGRIKMSLDPYNIEVFREILFNEILTNKPIEEILLKEQEKMFRYALDKRQDEVIKKYTLIASEKNSEIKYFQYKESLKNYTGL